MIKNDSYLRPSRKFQEDYYLVADPFLSTADQHRGQPDRGALLSEHRG